ncbi:NADP-dependent oxidoreductase [Solirubrobacter soli]|uniref:NADP-dependent oxidoreductase n=1 Tax=Solirubrobacter soli TaxID=363832 RepID=UPI0004032762|nr:NADP-dependent oxidoreductase [Solirubrobacter soli]
MKAIAVKRWGGREALELLDVEPPPVAPDGVLVRVRAASLNPVDYKVREGKLAGLFPFHFPVILGWDAAGVVEKVGPAVTWFAPGDPVYGYCRRQDLQYGTYAEFTSVPEGFLAHMPPELTFEEAAALPLAGLTAHQSLERLGLRGGEWLFVTGGAGGVGHLAIQLALARGARVIATGSEASFDFIQSLGAEPVDYDGDVAAKVRELTDGGGADAAFDLFGGDGLEQAFGALRHGGRLVSIAAPPSKREHIETGYIFVRPSGYDLGEVITPLVAEGGLRPHIAETFALEDAARAQELLEGGHVHGKLVLKI